MEPLTNHFCITVIGTVTVLTGAFIYISIKAAADLRKFRQNIKPGDYANIDINNNYCRCKLIGNAGHYYTFRVIDTQELIAVTKQKIYQP